MNTYIMPIIRLYVDLNTFGVIILVVKFTELQDYCTCIHSRTMFGTIYMYRVIILYHIYIYIYTMCNVQLYSV